MGRQDEFTTSGETAFPLTVVDAEGQRLSGRLVLAQGWRPELGGGELAPGEEFRIVILGGEPSAAGGPPAVSGRGIAVCVPATPTGGGRALREAPVPYQAGAQRDLPAIPPSALVALARGRILTLEPLPLLAEQVFLAEQGEAALGLLAQALVAQRQEERARVEAGAYLQALAAALRLSIADRREGEAMAATLTALRGVLEEAAGAARSLPAKGAAAAREAISRLQRLLTSQESGELARAAGEAYLGPLELAEDVYFCRALLRDPAAALEMAEMRAFVGRAEVPPSLHELFTDHAAQREDLTAAVIADHPHSFAGVRSRFQLFCQRYQRAYLAHHQRYWRDASQLHGELQGAAPKAGALARLNTLRELGSPLGRKVLALHGELLAASAGCPAAPGTAAARGEGPICPACGVTLAGRPPRAETVDLLRALDRALAQQLQRLASEAVGRILARRGEERLERFLKVAQASDLAGLAAVLDDRLLEFLRQLLAEARARVPLPPLLEQLGRAYPQVGEEEVEAVTQDLAMLLRQALQEARRTPPAAAK